MRKTALKEGKRDLLLVISGEFLNTLAKYEIPRCFVKQSLHGTTRIILMGFLNILSGSNFKVEVINLVFDESALIKLISDIYQILIVYLY